MTGVEESNVIVVGAGSGIGAAAARLLADRGARVACLDIDEAGARKTADEITSAGGTAVAAMADVVDQASVERAFGEVTAGWDQLHALVNCVGITGQVGVASHEVDVDRFDTTCAINLRGALVLSQAALPRMLPHGYGRIAHVASIAGKEGNPFMLGYSASKAGLIGMVKAMGKEYAESGITVNALAPAVIQTPILDGQPEEVITYMTEKIPMRRVGQPEEAAEMLAWMVSPQCSFTTGFTFDLSGGRATY